MVRTTEGWPKINILLITLTILKNKHDTLLLTSQTVFLVPISSLAFEPFFPKIWRQLATNTLIKMSLQSKSGTKKVGGEELCHFNQNINKSWAEMWCYLHFRIMSVAKNSTASGKIITFAHVSITMWPSRFQLIQDNRTTSKKSSIKKNQSWSFLRWTRILKMRLF